MEKVITKKDVIGLIGIGTMGKCMLTSIVKAGYTVFAYDPFQDAQEFAKQNGAKIVSNINELAKDAKIIIMSLPTPNHSLNSVKIMKKYLHAGQVIVDTSTVGPKTSMENAKIAEECDCKYIDAPILGRPDAVGTWMLPAGGDLQVIENISKVIETFAKKIVCVGDVGSGNAFKLLNQLMFSVINCISAETMVLSEKIGINKKTFYDVISNSNAATVSGLFKETASRIAEDRYDDPTFTVELLCKDVGLGIDMIKEEGLNSMIASFVQSINNRAKESGYMKKDTSAIAKIFEDIYNK